MDSRPDSKPSCKCYVCSRVSRRSLTTVNERIISHAYLNLFFRSRSDTPEQTPPQKVQSTTPFRLLELPLEIRLLILELVLCPDAQDGHALTFTYAKPALKPDHRSKFPFYWQSYHQEVAGNATYHVENAALHPAILLTCRQLYKEGLEPLYSRNKFAFIDHMLALMPFFSDIGHRARLLVRHIYLDCGRLTTVGSERLFLHPDRLDWEALNWTNVADFIARKLRTTALHLTLWAPTPVVEPGVRLHLGPFSEPEYTLRTRDRRSAWLVALLRSQHCKHLVINTKFRAPFNGDQYDHLGSTDLYRMILSMLEYKTIGVPESVPNPSHDPSHTLRLSLVQSLTP
jgi:hypothetical protein